MSVCPCKDKKCVIGGFDNLKIIKQRVCACPESDCEILQCNDLMSNDFLGVFRCPTNKGKSIKKFVNVNEFIGCVCDNCLHRYTRTRFVDPINGSDTNLGDAMDSPFRTLTRSLESITDNSDLARYNVLLFPGTTAEPGPLQWKPFVTLVGFGNTVSMVDQDVTFDGVTGLVTEFDFRRVRFMKDVLLDAAAARAVLINFIGTKITGLIQYDGGPFQTFPEEHVNSLLLYDSEIDGLIIDSGAVFARDGNVFRNTITINNSDDGVSPFLDVIGGRLEGNVDLFGNAMISTRGTQNLAVMSATAVGGVNPRWETDSSSMQSPSMLPLSDVGTFDATGDLAVVQGDQIITSTTFDFQITKETVVLGNATGLSDITITLPSVLVQNREIIVKRLNSGANDVIVESFEGALIDNATTKTLTVQFQFIGVISDGTIWHIIRS